MIKMRNSRTGKVEKFVPQNPKNIRMYVCGPTVYGAPHIGNARAAVVFDVWFRLLREVYGAEHVTYVSNYTDIDDKIIDRSRNTKVPIEEITSNAIFNYEMDMTHLNVLQPTIRTYATSYVSEMIQMIQQLVQKGHAFVNITGDVLFDVSRNPHPGLEDNRKEFASRLVDHNNKEDSRDFVLWKRAKEGEPFWPSPWGDGRPGWHIECSAMIQKTLGKTIDIHGGGTDLKFPHHHAECAQSHCANDAPLANYWLHSDMVHINSSKMAKSRGNTLTVRHLNSMYPGEVIRMWYLMTHYRSILSYDDYGDNVGEAKLRLDTYYRMLYRYRNEELPEVDHYEPIMASLCNDLNVSNALQLMFKLSNEIVVDGKPDLVKVAQVKKAGDLLGILQYDPEDWFHTGPNTNKADAEHLISLRTDARKERNWSLADDLRAQLSDIDVIVEDHQDGPFWYTRFGDIRPY